MDTNIKMQMPSDVLARWVYYRQRPIMKSMTFSKRR